MVKKIFKHKLTVRYFETDQMGFVYYAHYLVWFEATRTDLLKSWGFPYKKMEQMGFFLPVAEAHCKYMAPAHYEDDIIVEAWMEQLKNVSIKIAYNVKRDKDSQLLAQGYTVHTCLNQEKKIVPFPDEFRKIFE